ncbi:DUF4241 domain-containing protein [Desertivirga brevis]|uniref:DUF4241 domain-containing protein n=1 Tax=Desertivirga brevis TaxID=2810310 RepID=UPI001A974DAC|nr:DUF4241 domain-containing protein [Pedobacter sp. SYSU D00873]
MVEKKAPGSEYQEHLSMVDYNLLLNHDSYNSTPLEILNLGELTLPTGLIVAGDPLVMLSPEPFTKPVNPGKYPVNVVVAKTDSSGNRYALAQLKFSEKKALKWVLALKMNDNISDLAKDEYLGFPVDAGLACFADKSTVIEYQEFENKFMKEHPGNNIYDDLLATEFKKNAEVKDDPNDAGDWVNFKIPNSANNIIMFQSGFGDGVYPSYWGITEEGEVASLIIDFLVFTK